MQVYCFLFFNIKKKTLTLMNCISETPFQFLGVPLKKWK